MRFEFYVALRHLLTRKSHSAISSIARIALGGVAISTMALIVVLSVFNGIASLVGSMYSALDTDLQIRPRQGKYFVYSDSLATLLAACPNVKNVGQFMEEDALFGYAARQHIGRLLGVDDSYASITQLASHVQDGEFALRLGSMPQAQISTGIAYYLRIALTQYDPIEIYLPNRTASNWLNPATAFVQKKLSIGSVLSINAEFDDRTVVVPIEVMRTLLNYQVPYVSALSLQLTDPSASSAAKLYLTEHLPPTLQVMTRLEQNANLYRTFKSERLVVLLILLLILLIASFNIVGSLSMLLIDKRLDIAIFTYLGLPRQRLRRIFHLEGMLISAAGAVLGLVGGLVLCWVQMRFGLVTFGNYGSFVVNVYPVELRLTDVLLVLGINLVLAALAAWLPAHFLTRSSS